MFTCLVQKAMFHFVLSTLLHQLLRNTWLHVATSYCEVLKNDMDNDCMLS